MAGDPAARPDDELDRTLAALADPHRRRVVELLGERPRPAGELARLVGLSPPAMSRHLRVLRTRGLIDETRVEEDARVRLYRLRPEPFDELEAWLREVGAFWDDQLEAFRAHVDRRSGDRGPSRGPGRGRDP